MGLEVKGRIRSHSTQMREGLEVNVFVERKMLGGSVHERKEET